jgi:hypothetical protein
MNTPSLTGVMLAMNQILSDGRISMDSRRELAEVMLVDIKGNATPHRVVSSNPTTFNHGERL